MAFSQSPASHVVLGNGSRCHDHLVSHGPASDDSDSTCHPQLWIPTDVPAGGGNVLTGDTDIRTATVHFCIPELLPQPWSVRTSGILQYKWKCGRAVHQHMQPVFQPVPTAGSILHTSAKYELWSQFPTLPATLFRRVLKLM